MSNKRGWNGFPPPTHPEDRSITNDWDERKWRGKKCKKWKNRVAKRGTWPELLVTFYDMNQGWRQGWSGLKLPGFWGIQGWRPCRVPTISVCARAEIAEDQSSPSRLNLLWEPPPAGQHLEVSGGGLTFTPATVSQLIHRSLGVIPLHWGSLLKAHCSNYLSCLRQQWAGWFGRMLGGGSVHCFVIDCLCSNKLRHWFHFSIHRRALLEDIHGHLDIAAGFPGTSRYPGKLAVNFAGWEVGIWKRTWAVADGVSQAHENWMTTKNGLCQKVKQQRAKQ